MYALTDERIGPSIKPLVTEEPGIITAAEASRKALEWLSKENPRKVIEILSGREWQTLSI